MIDKFFYSLFGGVDKLFQKLHNLFSKKKIKKVDSPDNRMNFPLE